MKIRITRRMKFRAVTAGIWVTGLGSWRLVLEGYPVGAVILLIMAVTFTIARESAFPFEVRGFPPA